MGLNGEDDFKTLDDYLDCDLIIIDEFSMVDTWLANQLFEKHFRYYSSNHCR
ncbi:AAA family ATPase [Streptococcus thermophilus]